MINYILKRIGLMFLTLWFVITITFTAMYLIPGDPYNSEKLSEEVIYQMDEANGFNRPFLVQYTDYFTNILGLEGLIRTETEGPADDIFGFTLRESYATDQDVSKILAKAYPISFSIGMVSVVLGVVLGIFLGVLASIKKNSFWDYIATIIAVVGVSFPSFVIAAYLQYNFAVNLGWFPTLYSKSNSLSYVLPIAALSFFAIAQVARVTRTEMLEVLNSNYIILAKAKGVGTKKVIFQHAFRNTLVSVITIIGPLTISLTTGSLVIEKIFAIPGIGDKLVPSVLTHDVFLVLGCTILIALQILITYLAVDILYVFVDPRIAIGGKNHE
ncbi:MAG: ABC transporter permease [Mycoplasmatales bacterium]